ncbi:MAG TPA: hypothetical protein VEL79_12575, partial [Vicinamibacterales bacterium]|nr:hypothetical protein [Vicinamibacterales bacterium]
IGETPDAPTWQPARLEYLATVTATDAQGSTTLDVHPDDTGAIDWTAFDVRERAAGPPPPASTRSIVPAHVRFKGMPNPRFWDFEDGTIDFGDLKPDKRDLARLALVDFMLVHSNDWFMLPLDVRVGGVHSLDRLIVRDVFGVDTLIERADREPVGPGRWTMFSTSIAGSADTADFLIVAPTAGAALQFGPVVEDVRFARDEMANMVWAIENVLENAAGGAWPQRERDAARGAGAGPTMSNATAPLVYRVESRVPEYWIPLLPVSLDPAAGAVALELAAALGADGHTPILPRGRILRPTGITAATPYRLAEEEVPRNGVRVQRLTCRSRWSDGSTFLWQQRRVEHGTGETHSALRFDQVLSTGAPP